MGSLQGYLRTIARDIATTPGVSLASIGYHFGSKEALLNAAMMEATGEWGDQLERALAIAVDPQAPPMERFELVWTRIVDSLAEHRAL